MRGALSILLVFALPVLAGPVRPHKVDWPNGKPKERGAHKDGKRWGEWLTYYESGKRQSLINYKDGRMHGRCAWWHENGQLKQDWQWRKGRPWKENGFLISYHANGAVWSKVKYVKGKPADQLQTAWHDNGKKEYEGRWKGELQTGKWTYWFRSGKKKRTMTFKKGQPNGWETTWSEQGKVTSRVLWKNGRKQKKK